MPDLEMDSLIDRLTLLLQQNFSHDISQIYFGDVGVYPPKAFRNARTEEKMIVAIVPNYDRADPKSRSGAAEDRLLGVFVAVMINMTKYLESPAIATEAPAERQLVGLTIKIRKFLENDDNFDLDRAVTSTKVGDINWEWMQRKDTPIRAAAIEYEARVTVNRYNP